MKITDLASHKGFAIDSYESVNAFACGLLHGHGETHVYFLHFDHDSHIGEHVAAFDQLLFVIKGEGWISGVDGVRRPLAAGQMVQILRGETHAKGSDHGMNVIMLQVEHSDT